MSDLISLVTLVAVLSLGLILWFYNSRQADALRGMARTTENMYMIQLKARRDERKRQPMTLSPLQWLAAQAGMVLSEVISVSGNPKWVNLRAGGGVRLVVSPLEPEELRKVLKAEQTKSRLNAAFEPLLGDKSRTVTVTERSLQNEEWFDLEAAEVGCNLSVHWGEVSRLWFYVIAPKTK